MTRPLADVLAPPPFDSSDRPWRIVLADDQSFDRAEAKSALLKGSARRYTFVECETAAEAVAAVCEVAGDDGHADDEGLAERRDGEAAEHVDCLVLDYNLPDGEAPDVLARLPTAADGLDLPAVPVVVITGSGEGPGSTSLNRTALRGGAQNFVGKDWLTPASLTRAVEGAIERHAMSLELAQQSRALRASEERLAAMNEKLEHRVAERTAELEEANAVLHERNAELQQFAYVASHDLQEPLRMVSSFLQLLQRRYADQLDETADEYIAYAVDGASRMKGLISDLLAFSRVGTRGQPLQHVDLNRTVETVLRDLQPAIEETGVEIEVADLPTVQADPSQIGQVFQNLLTNAIKFRKQEGPARIEVGARREDAAWALYVHDDGIGLEQQYADRVFQIFQRLHARDEYEGTGIGLAIVKRIVERHDGSVWFESEEGEGTTFFFTLPDADSA